MAWQMGHPLSQTLFTSIYIDRLLSPNPLTLEQSQFIVGGNQRPLPPLVQNVLRPYCLGTIKSCDLVLQKIMQELFYDVREKSPD